jgi:hypothetical protein
MRSRIPTGVTREQWKYKLGLWRLKKEQVEASAKAEPSKTYAVAASLSAAPDPAKTKTEYALLQTEWRAKQRPGRGETEDRIRDREFDRSDSKAVGI